MKRNCKGCRALKYHIGPYCELGYKTKYVSEKIGGFEGNKDYYVERLIPQEECPKPKTYAEYFRLLKIKRSKK